MNLLYLLLIRKALDDKLIDNWTNRKMQLGKMHQQNKNSFLRNIKFVLTVYKIPYKFKQLFQKHYQNFILKITNKIVLTIYTSQNITKKIHVTGIKNVEQKKLLFELLNLHKIKIEKIVVNNTFFLLKNLNIPEFDKFATFCSKYKQVHTFFNLSSYNSHENFLSVIYLKIQNASGQVNIHRKSSILLGCKTGKCVEILTRELKTIFLNYVSSLNSN